MAEQPIDATTPIDNVNPVNPVTPHPLDGQPDSVANEPKVKPKIKKKIADNPLFPDYKGTADPNYDPLTSEPVIERQYAKPAQSAADVKDIPEPIFVPPTTTQPTATQPNKPPLKDTPLNPSMSTATTSEQNRSAEQLAEAILNGYDLLHRGARWYVQISEDKLQDMYIQGEISPEFGIPLNETGSRMITFHEYVQSFNAQTGDALTVSEEFKAEVKPVLTRVLQKYGMGLTDEQTLIVLFGQDLLIKASLVVSFKKSMNKNVNIFSSYYKEMAAKNQPKGQSSSGSQQQQQPKNKTEDINYEEVLEKEER